MKRLFAVLSLLVFSLVAGAQVSITAAGSAHTQNFNTLSDTTLTNPYSGLPSGWFAQELGSGANTQYRAAWGQLGGGDLYSFGDSAVKERALGSLGSGTLAPVFFGIALVNNTGATVQQVRVAYRGEVWRVGNPARSSGPDTLHFAWGRNNSGINAGTFTRHQRLSFASPVISTHPNEVAVNGNTSAYQTMKLDTLAGLNLAPGDTLWLQWSDYNSASFDDGLAIDDLSVTYLPGPTAPVVNSRFLTIDTFDRLYRQNFDTIAYSYAASGNFSALPRGWFAHETGSGADNNYRTSYGEFAGGTIYSFGDSASSERALGSIGSGSVTRSDYGPAWINRTGSVVDNIEITFTGEQWRMGRPGRGAGPDTLHFSYAKNVSSIGAAGYTAAPTLNFFAPVTKGTLSTPMNGNLPANRRRVNGLISNLALQPNDTLWIRWSDFDSESFDDGLAIDSFSLAAVSTPSLLNMSFLHSNTTISEDSLQVRIPVRIFNKTGFLSQVEVFLADKGTIDTVRDIRLSSAYVSFPGTRPDTIAFFNFGVINSEPFEDTEYFVLGLRNPRNGQLGAIRYDTVWIINHQYQQVALDSLATNDSQGFPDSLGKTFAVEGVVHGVNYSVSGGLDFYIMDPTGGINVYEPRSGQYRPSSGDKLRIWGTIGQFRGLTRIESLDSIQLLSAGNALQMPRQVQFPGESDESVFLRMDSLRLLPQIARWPSNLEVLALSVDGRDTLRIYVSSETDLTGMTAPSGYFNIMGIGSQFNSSTNPPYNNGYRVMAVSRAYTIPSAIETVKSPTVRIYPNPVRASLRLEADEPLLEYSIRSVDGRIIASGRPQAALILVDATVWVPGLYSVQIRTATQCISSKIIKL